jgi:hypothetical protein
MATDPPISAFAGNLADCGCSYHDRQGMSSGLSEWAAGQASTGRSREPSRWRGPVRRRSGELGADSADLGLGDAGLQPEGAPQVVDLPGRDPVHVGLHDHGEQGRSIRRRRCPMLGKKLPCRSFGIFRSTSPALVESNRSSIPLRWVVREAVRSKRSAPIRAVASASIRASSAPLLDARRR